MKVEDCQLFSKKTPKDVNIVTQIKENNNPKINNCNVLENDKSISCPKDIPTKTKKTKIEQMKVNKENNNITPIYLPTINPQYDET